MSAAVVVMAKLPWPGKVKTRLVPPLSEGEAAGLYLACLRDRLEQVRALDGVAGSIAYAPAESEAFFADLAPGFFLVGSLGHDLGTDLAAAFAALFGRGHERVIAVDSDSPTLPSATLQRALELLADPSLDVVLGPAEDGGYYLVGLRAPQPALFTDMPWSTSGVAAETLRRCRELGLRVACLEPWYDVDTPADLARLEGALAGDPAPARATRRFLATRSAARHELADAAWTRRMSRQVHRTPWLTLREDLVELPDGRLTTYGVVATGECVGILPFVDPGTVLLVRQYRYVAGRATWEMPTGGVNAGEQTEAAAQRELAEEAGVQAGKLTRISSYHTSKSIMDETAHLFIGEDLAAVDLPCDETELIRVRPFRFAEVVDMVDRGEITDGMTIIAVLWAARRPTA